MLGIYVIIGLYHLFLFLRGSQVYYDLYFGLLCLAVTAYFFLAAPAFREFFSGSHAVLRLRVEFATLSILSPLALLFIEQLLRGRNPPLVRWLLVSIALPWPLIAFGRVQIIHYSLFLIHATMPITLLYLLYRILRETLGGNRDARLLLLGTFLFLCAVLHDVLLAHQILKTPPIASAAFAVLLPSFAALLANRVIRTQRALRDLNRHLEERVSERTADLDQARTRAEEANRAKSRFLAAMSHEIRTPLQAMLGAADLLVTTDEQDARKNLGRMLQQAGGSLSTLIEDTLDLARIEADRVQLNPAPFDLHETIQTTANILRIKAQQKKLELRVDIQAEVPVRVFGDAGRLSQILLNLTGNAVKFTETGGVDLRARLIETWPETKICIEVQDSGPGIALKDQARIFEAFEQAPDFISRSQSGAGLGLAISTQLAELMRGEITLESEPGAGSCFRLTLPVIPLAAATDDSQESAPELDAVPASATPRILIAEDNPDIRQLLALYVRYENWRVDFAENGREAIERIKEIESESPYDLIVLDIQMPKLDGRTTARILRRWERRRRAPRRKILAFTAHAMQQEREAILAAGCDALIVKPIIKADFLNAVHETLAAITPAKRPTPHPPSE